MYPAFRSVTSWTVLMVKRMGTVIIKNLTLNASLIACFRSVYIFCAMFASNTHTHTCTHVPTHTISKLSNAIEKLTASMTQLLQSTESTLGCLALLTHLSLVQNSWAIVTRRRAVHVSQTEAKVEHRHTDALTFNNCLRRNPWWEVGHEHVKVCSS